MCLMDARCGDADTRHERQHAADLVGSAVAKGKLSGRSWRLELGLVGPAIEQQLASTLGVVAAGWVGCLGCKLGRPLERGDDGIVFPNNPALTSSCYGKRVRRRRLHTSFDEGIQRGTGTRIDSPCRVDSKPPGPERCQCLNLDPEATHNRRETHEKPRCHQLLSIQPRVGEFGTCQCHRH